VLGSATITLGIGVSPEAKTTGQEQTLDLLVVRDFVAHVERRVYSKLN